MIGTDTQTQKRPLYDMFTAVPRRYDLVNHLITLGLDKRWRGKAARQCLSLKPKRILDLGCGTGDLAINLIRLAEYDIEVTGLDYSQPMLEIATKKAGTLSLKKPSFVQGDAANLPFPNGYFDCVGISFAFRNLTYKNPLAPRHLAEVLRVLSPDGRFVIVETSQPKSKVIRQLFHLYLRGWVYRMGTLVSGNKGAYHYLSESAARFFTTHELEKFLLAAGFRQVSSRPLFFGAVNLCVAVK